MKNFTGRDRELEVLGNIHSEAKSGDAAGIFLSGRSGIGKTELLRQVFYHYFSRQNNAVPFFYTVRTSLTSLEHFSKDYFCSFIVQSLAFLKKDISMIEACVYSFEDVMELAKESGVRWIIDIADDYEQARKSSDPLNLFLSTILAPYRSYLLTGVPVIVLLDDFHKMKKFCEINAVGDNRDFWMLFETPVKSGHTPHIFSGNQAELNRMFFEDTLFGEYLELFNLSGLARDDAAKYFKALCETYGLDVRIELSDFIDLFGGSPYYIRNFAQAARQSSGALSEDNFWLVYLSELTKGKTFKYWLSLLKTHVPRFNQRKPSLGFLYQLCKKAPDAALPGLADEMSVSREEMEQSIELFRESGIVETGFSTFEVADDSIMVDIIKGLYLKEVGLEPWSRIKETLTGDKRVHAKPEPPSFTLNIPATSKAEFVAVKTIEYIALNFNIPSGITGQLQIAFADLFGNVIDGPGRGIENYFLKFQLRENIFYAEITIPYVNIVLTDADRTRLRAYLDGLTSESVAEGTKITLLKEISADSVGAGSL